MDPWVKRFLLTPIRINRFPPWNLTLLLEALMKAPFVPALHVSVRFLSLNLAFLLAITTARGISDLQALSIKEPLLLVLKYRVDLRQDPPVPPQGNLSIP